MTRITQMVCHGFKSFARRTELIFGERYNVVLGPNGSGKSNVLDAICFVLGRVSAKSLRAEKSANLIYNGGKTKKPADKAEVSITFDNSTKEFPIEDKEVRITRIVNAGGQSVYKINGKRRTRQQVLDMLAVARIEPEGYNIILQGDIIKFVEMSSIERRQIIEEISGISIYEDKKIKAVAELEKVESKLKEAEIILTERETYMRELKKERDQALKYKETKDRIDRSKATILNFQLTAKREEKETVDKARAEQEKKLAEANSGIEKFKKSIEQKRATIEQINKEIEEKGEREQVAIMKEIETLRVEIATGSANIDNYKNELEKIKQRREQLKADSKDVDTRSSGIRKRISELQAKRTVAHKDLAGVEKAIDLFKQKKNLGDLPKVEAEIQEIDKKTDKQQEIIQKLREEQQNLLREKDKLEYQIKTLDERIDKVKQVEAENKRELDSLKKRQDEFKSATLELNKSLAEDSSLAAQLSKNRDELIKKREELSKLEARSVGIREGMAANIAVQKIIEQKKHIGGIFGTVAELGKVSSKYSLALEIAAGNRISNVVVKDDKVAAECISYLKSNKLGTVTFLPLNKLRPPVADPEVKKLTGSNGVHGIATDLVDYSSQFKDVFQYVFGNTLIVDNIEVSRRIGIGKARMVTMEGDLAELSGAMTGGFRKKREGLAFQEKEMTDGMGALESRVQELEDLVSILQKRRVENEQKIVELRNRKGAIEGDIIKTEKTLHLEGGDTDASKQQKTVLQRDLKDADSRLNDVNKKIEECNREFAQIKAKKIELRMKISSLQNPALLAELNTLEEKRRELLDDELSAEHEVKAQEMQLNEMLGPELEKIDKILKQIAKEEEQFRKEIEKGEDAIEKKSKTLLDKEQKQKKFYAQFKELFAKRDQLTKEAQDTEGDKIRKEEQSRQVELKINNFALKNAGVTAELAGLEKEFEAYQGLELFTDRSEQALKAEITRFETMVSDMGNINLKALEVYETVEREYKGLLQKKEKLSTEKIDVVKLMDEIEARKGTLFMETFNTVNDQFKQLFHSLSTKGEAGLQLENPDTIFDGGVRIKVRMSGTRYLDIRGLSGGEKTLTALAFIFAIQEHEPASFYVLDEVDAALDKQNSEKLAKLIRRYSDRAQYVVITHNDAVISEADNLYGVSIDEHGASKVVSLKI